MKYVQGPGHALSEPHQPSLSSTAFILRSFMMSWTNVPWKNARDSHLATAWWKEWRFVQAPTMKQILCAQGDRSQILKYPSHTTFSFFLDFVMMQLLPKILAQRIHCSWYNTLLRMWCFCLPCNRDVRKRHMLRLIGALHCLCIEPFPFAPRGDWTSWQRIAYPLYSPTSQLCNLAIGMVVEPSQSSQWLSISMPLLLTI